MSLTAGLLTAVAAALLGELWRSHRLLARGVDPSARAARLDRYPPVTVIRPIRGLDAGAAENLHAALDPGYPGAVEILFVLDDDREPALPLIREALAAARRGGRELRAEVLFCGRPPAGRTGKLHAMIAGLRQAKGEIIVFADSDIRPDREALRVLVETLLADPQAGAAFAPTVAVEPPRTVGDAGYSLLLNGLYGPAFAHVAHRQGGHMPFIMGQFMAFTRTALDAIGGLETADGQLVDDMYLGRRLVEEGYRNAVSPQPVPIIQRDLPAGEFLSTYVRWITFSRSGLPGRAFKWLSWLRGAVFFLGLGLAALAATEGVWLAAALAASASLGTAASINVLHRIQGGGGLPTRHLWVAFALLLSAPIVMAWILTRREVTWRGRRYALDARSRLASPPLAAPAPAALGEPVSVSTSLTL